MVKFNDENYLGFIDYPTRNIFLKRDKDIKETFNHEVIHAFLNEIYLNKKIKNKKIIRKLRSYEPFIEGLRFLISQSLPLFK